MVSKEFRSIVRTSLKKQGLSVRRAALQAELSPSYLSRILRGERDFPSTDAILRLARVLGIHPPDLLLAHAGRVRLRAAADLTDKQISQVMQILHDVVRDDRRSAARKSP